MGDLPPPILCENSFGGKYQKGGGRGVKKRKKGSTNLSQNEQRKLGITIRGGVRHAYPCECPICFRIIFHGNIQRHLKKFHPDIQIDKDELITLKRDNYVYKSLDRNVKKENNESNLEQNETRQKIEEETLLFGKIPTIDINKIIKNDSLTNEADEEKENIQENSNQSNLNNIVNQKTQFVIGLAKNCENCGK